MYGYDKFLKTYEFQKMFMTKYGDKGVDLEQDAGPGQAPSEWSGFAWQLLEPIGYNKKIQKEFTHYFEGEAMGFFSMK